MKRIDYNSLIEKGNQQYESLMNIAKGDMGGANAPSIENMSDSQKDKWLLAKGYRPDIKPNGDTEWIMPKKTPIERISQAQKIKGSMSPESLKATYPFLQYYIDNYIPVVMQLAGQVSDPSIMMSEQAFSEAIDKLNKNGLKQAIDATGGMSAQGKGKLAQSSSYEESQRILARYPNAINELLKMSDYEADKAGS